MNILALDVGTERTAYTLLNSNYEILSSDIISNEELLIEIKKMKEFANIFVFEEFASYGMPIGKTTMEAIKWNGRFIQKALDCGYKEIVPMLRKDVKINLCQTMKAKDTNIRVALVERYAKHDFKRGKGTKDNPDVLYGFKKDMYSSLAIATTYFDKKQIEKEINKYKSIKK